jgi:ribosomal protein L35
MRTKAGKGHFRRRQSTRVKQSLDKLIQVNPVTAKRIKHLAPYLAMYRQNPPQ